MEHMNSISFEVEKRIIYERILSEGEIEEKIMFARLE
jgi:hypothetical protein